MKERVLPIEGAGVKPAPMAAGDATAGLWPWSLYSANSRWTFVVVRFLISSSNYFDRHILSVLLELIKREFRVSDAMLGLLGGFSFMILNAALAIPIARLADRTNRRTIIAVAVAAWSLATMACSLAQTFWQLAIARAAVGGGEAGALPTAHSLIVDYFPPDHRATPLAIYSAGTVVGSMLAFSVGGYIASIYGWRAAFLVAGAPGLLLALAARFLLSEPRSVLGYNRIDRSTKSLTSTLGSFWAKPSYRYALVGFVLSWFVSYGPFIFIPSYMVRVLRIPLSDASVSYGLTVAFASAVGTLMGGWLGDRLGRHDKRWLAWLPAVASIISGLLFIAAFLAHSFQSFLWLMAPGYILLASSSSIYAAFHAISATETRATAIAIILLSATIIGGGLGPLVTGWLSDLLSQSYGVEGLRYALIGMMAFSFLSGVFYYLFGRAMIADLAD